MDLQELVARIDNWKVRSGEEPSERAMPPMNVAHSAPPPMPVSMSASHEDHLDMREEETVTLEAVEEAAEEAVELEAVEEEEEAVEEEPDAQALSTDSIDIMTDESEENGTISPEEEAEIDNTQEVSDLDVEDDESRN